ncbi:MAG: hypothetical protein QOE65_600 [Solirubrobacteraceae bacterium]|jgi:CBS domain-containing protein|nr:hypothetical protein [Solirubrobacteraceae bacterium]
MPAVSSKQPVRGDQVAGFDRLDGEVREVMTPGVVSLVETASLRQGYRALVAHGVHSVLVLGRTTGKPLGWVTARGLLGRMADDAELFSVGDAITHPPATIEPTATLREAISALAQPGISQLIVAEPDALPQGVLSDLDLIAAAAG